MKKLLSIFSNLPTFIREQEMEADKRPLRTISLFLPTFGMVQEFGVKQKPKEHYLIRRKNKLLKLLQCARMDKNDYKAKQAERLIKNLEKVLSINSKLLYAHIENKDLN